MLNYREIKEVFDKYSIDSLIKDYSQRQKMNKDKNEVATQLVVDDLTFDSSSLPGNYTSKLTILISALITSNPQNGRDIAKDILEKYGYHKNQEIIVATQYIDKYQTGNIEQFLFSYIMKALISVKFSSQSSKNFSLVTDFGNILVRQANEVLGIEPIDPENRQQLCHQITANAMLEYPNLYGAYYYINLPFKGYLEHSVLIDTTKGIVIDLANNSVIDLATWEMIYSNPAFIIKGEEFQYLYQKVLEDYKEHLHMATIEEVRRVRKQNR